jgi:hypothetical protein
MCYNVFDDTIILISYNYYSNSVFLFYKKANYSCHIEKGELKKYWSSPRASEVREGRRASDECLFFNGAISVLYVLLISINSTN